ncbi:lysylphosphatidylglycerol synthase transmembrane domain-containing protein [Haladaptatus sp. AB643]|uniref:lysylphosphatidylglycerol synthase transmembrane domain-containing protein n=1 Tax=Haladaptatus sp. AB643 TaxID=2934174 RepID=UPI00209BF3BD|nr:lysylphosphatidylglycerol synthase transmembrane domain-containing protein [Haladaptatus sp. AB643]MCO8242939.1 flippase-like domain-containing protein [Haladaptatus sp. AB643]
MRLDLGDMRTIIVGFVAAIAVLLVIFSLAGINEIMTSLTMADGRIVIAVAVVALAWLFSWSMSLRTVLRVLGIRISVLRAFSLYAGATFANNVTPFGQAGGEPFAALLISRTTNADYESSLGAIASVDSINFVPSISFALVGVAYYATVLTLGHALVMVALTLVAVAIAVPIVAILGWRNRNQVEMKIADIVVRVVGALARFVPRLTPTSKAAVVHRLRGFFDAIERVAGNRRGLALSMFFSAFGWFLSAVSLWLSFYALGYTVPFAAVLFVIPLGSMASITPLPGGLGGVDAVLVILLVPIAGVSATTASAAALIHRGATYFLPVLIGGSTTAMLEADNAKTGSIRSD